MGDHATIEFLVDKLTCETELRVRANVAMERANESRNLLTTQYQAATDTAVRLTAEVQQLTNRLTATANERDDFNDMAVKRLDAMEELRLAAAAVVAHLKVPKRGSRYDEERAGRVAVLLAKMDAAKVLYDEVIPF